MGYKSDIEIAQEAKARPINEIAGALGIPAFLTIRLLSFLLSHILTDKDWRINSSYGIIVSKLECIHKANRNI